MSPTLLPRTSSHRTTDGELTAGLRKALDWKYSRILRAARREWERSLAGSDPSDACVSVRISGSKLARPLPGTQYLAY